MKNDSIRFVSILLTLLMVMTLCACEMRQQPNETDNTGPAVSVPETTTAPPISFLDGDGNARFSVIRPDKASQHVVRAGMAVHEAMGERFGVSHKLASDFLMPKQTIEQFTDQYEILIGETNRPESAQIGEGLAANEYVVTFTGHKLVLIGGSDAATYQAVQAFLTLLPGDSAATLLEVGFCLRQTMESGGYLVALTNQNGGYLEVYDLSTGVIDDTTMLWSYKTKYNNVCGTKLRQTEPYGQVAMAVCSSSTYACMASYPEGKTVWSTESAASGPHSIEWIPCGVIAVASSTGGEIRFYRPTDSFSENFDATVPFEDAHGVLWDEVNQLLWAIGGKQISAYRVSITADGTVQVSEESGRRTELPTGGAHDLAPVYGDKDALWITTSSKVYRFQKSTKTFSTDYDGNGSLNRKTVKGVGNFPDGSIVYIYPDGELKAHTSKSMVFLRNVDGVLTKETLVSPTGHFYKVRVWSTDYQ